MRRFTVRVLAMGGGFVLAFAAAAGLSPIATAGESELGDIRVTAEFAEPPHVDRPIRVRVTVSNVGSAAVDGVRGWVEDGEWFDPAQWGDLRFGVRMEPGASTVVELHKSPNYAATTVHVALVVGGYSDANWADNNAVLDGPLLIARGDYTGLVYADKNDNGAFDPDEGLRDVTVKMDGGVPYGRNTQTTDELGRFTFTGLPRGTYARFFAPPGGWTPPQMSQVLIDETERGEDLVRLERPRPSVLTATVAFTDDSYAPGERADLIVTLTNTGPVELSEVGALCTGEGKEYIIVNELPGWGALAYQAEGVTIGAGETRTFQVWSTVPVTAFDYGFVSANCVFSMMTPNEVMAHDNARVPGGVGSTGGHVIHDRNSDGNHDGDGVPNTGVLLMDPDTQVVVARTVTDANGFYRFVDKPAGRHDVRVLGPWQIIDVGYPPAGHIRVGRDFNTHQILVVPGAEQPDPENPAIPPADSAPPPQGGVAPPATTEPVQLANTGADTKQLSLTGLAMLLAGTALLLVSRRPRQGPL